VAIATVGRPALVARTVGQLARQNRRADGVLIVGASPADVDGLAQLPDPCEIVLADRRGLCRQRNRALDHLRDRADVVIFLDDDFVMADNYLAEIEAILADDPEIIGITGDLLADGIRGPGITFEDAVAIAKQGVGSLDPRIKPRQALYGCNMVIRLAAAEGLRFDEALPLYGWQEDVDYTYQLGRRGRLVSTGRVTGVHMGVKSGRTSGVKLGYSQVANILYLKRKGTIEPGLGEKLLVSNILSNFTKSLRPEPWIDRKGRLRGNLMALADLVRGRLDPRKIEAM
jgi:glycosyltransferase involved in cell wall biosynthesis